MKLLSLMLKRFNSYAVLATHSVFIVREVPSTCVRVVKAGEADRTVVLHG
ncbi:MAG: hypothetical protein Q8L55_03905 [Phycisphaerales bacterium]|nr:hypothetical protein [Phycisphaerales bacterium]